MNLEDAHNVIFIERLRAKSTTNEKGCWLIHTSLDKDGYHVASYRGKAVRAHNKIFIILKGEIPEGMVIDHLCRNRNCCNPEHLEAVPPKENIQRGKSHNGEKTHCVHGHAFTPENTYKDARGHRHCNTCRYNVNKKRGEYRLEWQRNNKDKLHDYYTRHYAKKKLQKQDDKQ